MVWLYTMSITLKIRRLFEQARDRDCCGVPPFESCKLRFQSACEMHDIGYRYLRTIYLSYQVRPHIKHFKVRVLQVDDVFYAIVDSIIDDAKWYEKIYLKPMGESFKLIVKKLGWSVWVSKTREAVRLKNRGE